MTISQDYRQYAEECLRWAREAKDEAQRQQLLDLASAWIQAASLQNDRSPAAAKAIPHPRRSRLAIVSITPFLAGQAFQPETIRDMSTVFVDICEENSMSSSRTGGRRVDAWSACRRSFEPKLRPLSAMSYNAPAVKCLN